jgi:DNA-binding NarL/FixJ family response regulator
MATPPPPTIAVLARSKYRAEALALSISAHMPQSAFALNWSERSELDQYSTFLVDLDMNIEAALKVIRETVARRPHTTVVVLGLLESAENIVTLAEAGASGYVAAAASFEEMLSIIKTARRGEFACTPDVTFALFSYLAALAREREVDLFTALRLTTRERQVMQLMARDITNKEISQKLCVSEFTVKNHVHHLLTKLRVSSRRLVVFENSELSAGLRAAR